MQSNPKIDRTFEKWRSRWISAVLEAFIVYLVTKKERFGGELVKLSKIYIDESVKVPTVYAILKRLTDSGFLKEKSKLQEIGITRGKPRIYYDITELGESYYHNMQNLIRSSPIPCNFEEIKIQEDM